MMSPIRIGLAWSHPRTSVGSEIRKWDPAAPGQGLITHPAQPLGTSFEPPGSRHLASREPPAVRVPIRRRPPLLAHNCACWAGNAVQRFHVAGLVGVAQSRIPVSSERLQPLLRLFLRYLRKHRNRYVLGATAGRCRHVRGSRRRSRRGTGAGRLRLRTATSVSVAPGSPPELHPVRTRADAAATATRRTRKRRAVRKLCDVMGSYSPDSFKTPRSEQ